MNPNKVIKPIPNGKLRRGIIIGLVVTLIGAWITKEAWAVRATIQNTERLISIEKKIDEHIVWGTSENIKNQDRIKALEEGHINTANRFTKQDGELMEQRIMRWAEHNFKEK